MMIRPRRLASQFRTPYPADTSCNTSSWIGKVGTGFVIRCPHPTLSKRRDATGGRRNITARPCSRLHDIGTETWTPFAGEGSACVVARCRGSPRTLGAQVLHRLGPDRERDPTGGGGQGRAGVPNNLISLGLILAQNYFSNFYRILHHVW